MEAPYTVASLPKPLDSDGGRIQAAPVYGIHGSRKRKRHEVAVGIDGEGVNIYSVQNQSQAASYALPPQTSLCYPPCSVYCRKTKDAGAQRRTYIVVRDGPKDAKRRLVCIIEDVQTSKRLDYQLTGPKKREHKLQSGDIVSLEIVAASSAETRSAALQVLVSYKNGEMACIAGDLSGTSWTRNVPTTSDEAYRQEVEYATITDSETARKGLLAGREDVLATLDPADVGTGNAVEQPLLCEVVRSQGRRSLRLSSIRVAGHDAVQSQRSGTQFLTEYELPESTKRSSQHDMYELHAASGKLYQLLDGRLTVFDLTGTIPRVAAKFGSKARPIQSFARLSASTVFAVLDSHIDVYETRYSSVQASVSLNLGSRLAIAGSRRDSHSATIAPWTALSSFSELGVVVGLANNELSVLQLAEEIRSAKRSKSSGTLLVEVLGKGDLIQQSKTSRNVEKNGKEAERFENWKAAVDTAMEDGDMLELEDLVTECLQMETEEGQQEPRMPEASAAAHIDRRKVLYLLSMCFRAVSDEEAVRTGSGRLVALTESERIYRWFAQAGLLTAPYIQQALRQREDSIDVAQGVLPGDIMTALRWFDDFRLVHDVLALPIYWELPEVVQALALLIQSFETPAEGKAYQKALPAPSEQTNGDVSMVDAAVESEAESELLAAEKDLSQAVSALSSGLELRSETLRLVLRRLHAFPQKAVTNCMRTMMRHEEIIFFMKVLRIELLEGGWPNRYVDLGDAVDVVNYMDGAEEASGPSDQAISTISVLMNCAIDAIGTSGWLVGQGSDAYGTSELIDALKSEVSAALEGLYEADTVATFLHGLQGYEVSLQKARSSAQKRKRSKFEVPDDMEAEEVMLPMGSRAEPPVAKDRGKKAVSYTHLTLPTKRIV